MLRPGESGKGRGSQAMTPEEIQATESAPPIGGVPCPFYVPWSKADPNPLAIDECLEFSVHDGFCHEAMSPFSYQACPWSGYPEGTGLTPFIWRKP